MHASSYTTSILFSFTLDIERGVLGLILILLSYRYIDRSAIYFNITILYLSIFTAFFTISINEHIMECVGFFLYYNVVYIFWKFLGTQNLTTRQRYIRLYSFLAVPLIVYISPMILNPSMIDLDFYSDSSLEAVGLKSRTVGWAAAAGLPLTFEWARRKGPLRGLIIFLMILLLIMIIGSGSRSSILGSALFIAAMMLKLDHKYKLVWVFLLLTLTGFLIENADQLSLSRRAELHRMGVSDDTFRLDLVTGYFNNLWSAFPESIYPSGLGEPNMQNGLNKFFETGGFGTHNTYITVLVVMGIFSIAFFVRFYQGIRKLIRDKFLYFFLPALTISITEDCFGPGQLLYMFILAILAITSREARPRTAPIR